MALGAGSPLGFQLGGGLTHYERTYLALREAMGDGGAGPIGSVEDEWRKAKAQIISRSIALVELAHFQRFPALATTHIARWEQLLGLAPAATMAERQLAAHEAYTSALSYVIPQMRVDLAAIDPGLDVLSPAHELSVVTRLGRMFEATTEEVPEYPNYATSFVCTVLWTGLSGGIPDPDKLAQLQRYLQDLPAWIDWRIVNGVGFYLDGFNDSLLDLTAFSD